MICSRRPTPDEVTARLYMRFVEASGIERQCLRRVVALIEEGYPMAAAYVSERATMVSAARMSTGSSTVSTWQQHFAEALTIVLNPPKRSR